MKRILVAILIAFLAGLTWAVSPDVELLNTACTHLDNLCIENLENLQNVAKAPEAQSGNWQQIKPLLSPLYDQLSGVYFYVLPDGNYYSIALDYTNLNLSDRGYFKPLFSGSDIKGFPIYSRSSGKKSVVFAAPVTDGKKVSGAMGASIYLVDLHSRLNSDIVIPDNYTWFVVDSTGDTILDKEADYIFMNAITQGGESLATAIKTVVKNSSGTVSYELGGLERKAIYQKLPTLDWWMVMAKKQELELKIPEKLELSLQQFVPRLQHNLDDLDAYMRKTIAGKKSKWDKEKNIRKELKKIVRDLPQVVDVAFIDNQGILRYIEPAEYKNFENEDIKDQEQVAGMSKHPEPMFSNGFMAVEGYLANTIGYPLFNKKGKYLGFASLLIRPELMVAKLIKDSHVPEDLELWIMQPDGMIIYDQDAVEIGKMLFSDPIYSEYETLLELGKKIIAEQQGKGQYVYQLSGKQQNVVKTATWDTVQLHSKEWRVVITQPEKEQN